MVFWMGRTGMVLLERSSETRKEENPNKEKKSQVSVQEHLAVSARKNITLIELGRNVLLKERGERMTS